MKQRGTTILLLVVLLAGLSLLIYPRFSNWWNSFHSSRAVMSYTDSVSNLNREEYDRILGDAWRYNKAWAENGIKYTLSPEEIGVYEAQLNPGGNGIMGTVDIPSIDVHLPIYHGIDDVILQIAVGHLEWTALPVGGAGTHCVLSGHRGLPSARLFTDIDKLVEGDLFTINILGETLTYEVDQINIVLPEDIHFLMPEPGQDLMTLVTCTPYGVNTHRLLVRGHRVPNDVLDDPARVTADSVQIEPVLVAPAIGVPLVIILIGLQLAEDRFRRRHPIYDDVGDDDMDLSEYLP